MILKANLQEAVRSLAGSKQRTFLALLGIVIGIGSVIAMVSVGIIVRNEVLKHFKDLGTDVLAVQKDMGAARRQGAAGFRLAEVLAMPEAVPAVAAVAPYSMAFGAARHEGKKVEVPALGVTESFLDLCKLKLRRGRFISDLDQFMYHCVIGEGVARFFRDQGVDDPLGRRILFQDRLFTVVGEIERSPVGAIRPMDVNDGLLIPISTARRFEGVEIMATLVRLAPGADHQAAAARIAAYFQAKGRDSRVRIMSAEELLAQMETQMRLYVLLLGAIGSISLVVGGVGVMNVMLVTVGERRREIGVRRALGAQRADILGQFLIESVLLSLIGGGLGIALGVGVSWLIARYSGWDFALSVWTVALGAGVSAVVGVFFGIYPARQAARLNPIQALRSD